MGAVRKTTSGFAHCPFFYLEKIYLQVIELTQLLNISTRETADILASPSPATMSVSALPTSLKSSCSKNNGITRRRISFVVNREYLLSSVKKRSLFRNILFRYLQCFSGITSSQ